MGKTILIILLSFFLVNSLFSQGLIDNTENKLLIKKSAGLWQGVKGNDTFTVLLRVYGNNDSLFGWHQYKKDGVIESSTMDNKGNRDSSSIVHILTTKKQIKDKSLVFSFADHNRSENIFLVRFDVTEDGRANWTVFGYDMSEGQYNTYVGDVPPTVPPASEIMKIKEWTMTKIQ